MRSSSARPDADLHDQETRGLHHLRMSGAFYCHSELTEPWGLTLPELPGHMWLHAC